MIDIETSSGTIQIRGLTSQEVKQLKEEGFPIYRFGFDVSKLYADLDQAEKAQDRVFEIVLSGKEREAIENGPNVVSLKVWRAILDESFVNEAAEKN